jgi:hypothetical protein
MFRRSLLAFGRSAALQNKSVVSISEAQKQVTSYKDLPNDILLVMSRIGDQEAKEERLIREIMAKDNTDWSASQKTFASIVASNRKGLFLATLPYKFGIGAAVSAGVLSFPMIFDINTVMLFNESFVTADIPEPKDLETPLEVGSWAWNWMEPPLGVLCSAARRRSRSLRSTQVK